LLERFRIKVTTIEESNDLESMKIEELVGSLPPTRKAKIIALEASEKKKEAKVSSEEDSNNDEEDAMAMLAKNFERSKKKDPRGPKCFECPGFGHMWESQVGLREGLQRYSQ
jgi:hypothetical protein